MDDLEHTIPVIYPAPKRGKSRVKRVPTRPLRETVRTVLWEGREIRIHKVDMDDFFNVVKPPEQAEQTPPTEAAETKEE